MINVINTIIRVYSLVYVRCDIVQNMEGASVDGVGLVFVLDGVGRGLDVHLFFRVNVARRCLHKPPSRLARRELIEIVRVRVLL